MKKKLRSTTEAEKLEKKNFIMQTALKLYEEENYHLPSAEKIAKACGFAKGTLYTYFTTKEEIFLAILNQFFDNWFSTVKEGVPKYIDNSDGSVDVDVMIDMILTPIIDNHAFFSLASRIELVLEDNVSVERAKDYKLNVMRGVRIISQQLKNYDSFFATERGLRVIVETYALIIGFWHQAKVPGVLKQLMKDKEIEILFIDFKKDLKVAIKNYWKGCLQ